MNSCQYNQNHSGRLLQLWLRRRNDHASQYSCMFFGYFIIIWLVLVVSQVEATMHLKRDYMSLFNKRGFLERFRRVHRYRGGGGGERNTILHDDVYSYRRILSSDIATTINLSLRGGGGGGDSTNDDDDIHSSQSKSSSTTSSSSSSSTPPRNATTTKITQVSTTSHHLPIIVSFLHRQRPWSLLGLIRIISGCWCIFFSLTCWLTLGDPRRQYVWSILHPLSTMMITMPWDYQPTALDIFLTQRKLAIAAAVSVSSSTSSASSSLLQVMPPWFLPSTGPLLGLLTSLAVYVGMTILLPQWWTPAKVFLMYHRVSSPPYQHTNSITTMDHHTTPRWYNDFQSHTNNELQQQHQQQQQPTHVLVRLPQRTTRNHNNDSDPDSSGLTGWTIVPLHYIDVNSSSSTPSSWSFTQNHPCDYQSVEESSSPPPLHSHPYPSYFVYDFGRYYCDVNTGHVIEGSPDLHRTRSLSELLHMASSSSSSNPHLFETSSSSSLSTTTSTSSRSSISSNNTSWTHRSRLRQSIKYRQQQLEIAKERYGASTKWIVPQPTLRQALASRLLSPLVVVQMIGKLFSILEEELSSSIMQVLYILWNHYRNAKQSIVAAKELATEVATKNCDDVMVYVLRPSSSSDIKQPLPINKEEAGIYRPAAPKRTKATRLRKSKRKKPKRIKKSSLVNSDVSWQLLPAMQLLPGDVFVYSTEHKISNETKTINDSSTNITTTKREFPVDALLLQGQCVMNEAILTGESIPQTKVPITLDDDDNNNRKETNRNSLSTEYLDMLGKHRSSMLFAGTSVLHLDTTTLHDEHQCHQRQQQGLDDSIGQRPGLFGIKCLALRTGMYSSKGEVIRSLASFKGYIGSVSNAQGDKDALKLIACLSCFALASCISLFMSPSSTLGSTHHPSSFRRIIQCTRIAIASIPSDLPLALAAVTQMCTRWLRKESDVVCSDPGSMLTAAQVNVVVFDKTGTLTADTQSLSKVITFEQDFHKHYDRGHSIADSPSNQATTLLSYSPSIILAGCHSLVRLPDEATGTAKWVGDPLDLAALKYTQWEYNESLDCFGSKETNCLLWQIKAFPFDPNRRQSIALVIVQLPDGQRGLYKLVKGAPDTLQNQFHFNNTTGEQEWYRDRLCKLESEGCRTIAMGIKKLTTEDDLFRKLFPRGLEEESMISRAEFFAETVRLARASTVTVTRTQLESDFGFDMVGFSCFNAALRPSTRRVVQGLLRGGVHVTMLTGDAMDSGILVAAMAGFMRSNSTMAVLEKANSSELVYRTAKIMSHSDEVKAVPRLKTQSTAKRLTVTRLEKLLIKHKAGKLTLAASGDAIMHIIVNSNNKPLYSTLANNLHHFSVVARSSPSQKQEFVQSLKHSAGQVILMCGDGVNDVTAMKAADVGVALLNGFGDERSTFPKDDWEDEKRLERLKNRLIGSNRKATRIEATTSHPAAWKRVATHLQTAQQIIRQRAASRQGLQPDSDVLRYTLGDLKDLIGSVIEAVLLERRRSKLLQKGGGDAARILAQEHGNVPGVETGSDSPSWNEIKPGEASLAAPFSCLRPSIDGVDALMRGGVAACASSLSLKQNIALNCLLSSYNLATLYRDGFRYSKNMWKAEFMLYVLLDRSTFLASCTPRPHLPSVRPQETMFELTSALSVAGQALIHIVTLTTAARAARKLEQPSIIQMHTAPMIPTNIRFRPHSHVPKFAALVNAVIASHDEVHGGHQFRPNFETNVVFCLSCLQNVVTYVANYKGAPFYLRIIENRSLCLTVCFSFLFVAVCLTEALPALNEFLQLRPWPSRQHKLTFLAMGIVDVTCCFLWQRLLLMLFGADLGGHAGNANNAGLHLLTAAEAEDSLLQEESSENQAIVLATVIILVKLLADATLIRYKFENH